MKKMKRIMTVFLACLMLIAALPIPTQAARLPFRDVKTGFWYTEAITYVYENNLMSGLTKTAFGPEDSLTRAMFVTILGRMEGINTAAYQGASFRDVPANQWFSAYVKWASQKGIVSGYSSDYFGANDKISREQMASIITRYLDMKGITLNYAKDRVDYFTDAASVSTWAKKGVEIMRRIGIIKGNTSGRFLPANAASRAEAATVFMNLQKALKTNVRTEPVFVQSSQIQAYKGKTYTVLNMYSSANMIKVPGGYTTLLAVYENKIYYTEDCGTGGGPTSLYRMNLDGTGKTELLSNIDSTSYFCIYDDVLYYTASNWDYDYYSRSLDLNTLKISSEPYFYNFGTEHVWIISNSPLYYDADFYCCSPEYLSVQTLPEGSYWTEDLVTALYDDMMYYFMKVSVMKSSIYDKNNTTLGVGPYIDPYGYFQLGNGMYYWEDNDDIAGDNDDHLLHRLDLKSGIENRYDVRKYMYYDTDWGRMDCFGPLEEVNNKLYFTNYMEDSSGLNTKCYELDLVTGTVKAVGAWFES